jgi:hypothetical protein
MLTTVECTFRPIEGNAVQCIRCERTLPDAVGVDPAKIHARCRARCWHLQDFTGMLKVDCSCGVRTQLVHRCSLLGRCLPNFRPHGETLRAWEDRQPESELYQVCSLCMAFEPLPKASEAEAT